MKMILSVLMILALLLTGTAALAEWEPAGISAPDPDCFSGIWECDRATAEILREEEGYRILIHWSSSAWETTAWSYACYYHEKDNILLSTPFGIRTELLFGDNGNEVSAETVYDDGTAGFSLDGDGRLIWDDQKENAGEGMRFERVGDCTGLTGPEEDADG